jgi:hypothetical protein
MKHVVHHGYAITVTAHNEKGMWRARAIITWDEGKIELHDEVSFTTQLKALEHAIELGKHWVNNRFRECKAPLESALAWS